MGNTDINEENMSNENMSNEHMNDEKKRETNETQQLGVNEPVFTPFNLFLLLAYVLTWTLMSLLVRASRTGNKYNYDSMSVVLLIGTAKLFISLGLTVYLGKMDELISNWREGVNFAVPAFIYTLFNNLMFVSLVFFDPATYRVLINLRIFWSGLLSQIFLKRQLGIRKWCALMLLIFGCSVTALNDFHVTQILPCFM